MSIIEDLARSQAYRVDTRDGRIGSVAVVLPRAGGKPGFLLVQSGLMCCRLTTVPFSEVETVDPEDRRVLLRDVPASTQEAAPHGARARVAARA
jgi:hypothetical protein